MFYTHAWLLMMNSWPKLLASLLPWLALGATSAYLLLFTDFFLHEAPDVAHTECAASPEATSASEDSRTCPHAVADPDYQSRFPTASIGDILFQQ
ncbi:hypothetical protein [Massilia cavernae]|uniref:hypothetical protein n=1 Tax=Massilia cavernae TaxID=2320864 RepID=UPI0011C3546A|nr:hypothetical protein [Massilia cavernae]